MIKNVFRKQLTNSYVFLSVVLITFYLIIMIVYNIFIYISFKQANYNLLKNYGKFLFESYEKYHQNEPYIFEYNLAKISEEIDYIKTVIIYDSNDKIVFPKFINVDKNLLSKIPPNKFYFHFRDIFFKTNIYSSHYIYKGSIVFLLDFTSKINMLYFFLFLGVVLSFVFSYLTIIVIQKKFDSYLRPLEEFTRSSSLEDDLIEKEYDNELDYFLDKIQKDKKILTDTLKELSTKREQLFIENKRVQQLLLFRENLISMTTHELNIPLTIIYGYIEQIKKNPDKYLEKGLFYIEKNIKRIQNQIDNLIRLFKSEKGKFYLNIEKNSVNKLFNEIQNEYSNIMDKAGIKFNIILPEKEILLKFDFEEIKLCISNLLNNSIRYTEKGGIITLYLKEDKKFYYMGVEDTGQGIEKDKLSNIFEWYFQIANTKPGMFGIGLAIVKNTIEQHHWEIKIESEVNKGTNIYFVIRKNEKLS